MLHKDSGRDKESYHERGLLGFLVLVSLVEGDAHGYEIMKRVERITAGYWRPAPGSLYPVIDSLEKEGLIECYIVEHRGKQRRMCRLTDDGYRVLIDLLKRKIKVYVSVLHASLNAYHASLKHLNIIKTDECIKQVIDILSKLSDKINQCIEG
mgnify:CR=1 FL=1